MLRSLGFFGAVDRPGMQTALRRALLTAAHATDANPPSRMSGAIKEQALKPQSQWAETA